MAASDSVTPGTVEETLLARLPDTPDSQCLLQRHRKTVSGRACIRYLGTGLPFWGMTTNDPGWAPQACTLPTAERPVRVAEFDELFATGLRGQQRLARTRLRWRLDVAAEAAARDLTSRESECCSFFTFTFAPAGDALQLDVEVPAVHAGVLDALARRAAAGMRR